VEPLGGLERSLSHVETAIRVAEKKRTPLPVDELVSEVRQAAAARQSAVYHHLHTGGYRSERAPDIVARIPATLDTSMERFVLEACDLFGFHTAEKTGHSWYVEFGSDAIVEHLPGVPGGTRYLGTFAREVAVSREELDFFASGHPLVEGIFQELEDGSRGRAALVQLPRSGHDGAGLLILRRVAEGFSAAAFDVSGARRPEWAELLIRNRHNLKGVKADEWMPLVAGGLGGTSWSAYCERVASRGGAGRVLAAAGFVLTR
jgi:ATP-dependent helicase HepA